MIGQVVLEFMHKDARDTFLRACPDGALPVVSHNVTPWNVC